MNSNNPYQYEPDDNPHPTSGLDPNAVVAAKLEELGVPLDPDLPFRLDKMFPKLTGFGIKGQLKRRAKLIQNVQPRLNDVLLSGEEVWYIARGVQHSIIEAMTIGALWSNMINQTVFVLTNARLLLLHCNSKGVTSEPCWMIYYSEIKKFKARFTGVVTLKLNDGKSLQFSGFPKADRKSMPQMFEEAVEAYQERGFEPECSQSREDACSHCFAVVPKGTFECPSCGATFWKPTQIAGRSLLFPAWGDIIMKHYPLAVVEVLGYIFTWVVVVAMASDGDIAWAIVVLLFSHAVDALVTLMIARKGLHTKSKPAGSH